MTPPSQTKHQQTQSDFPGESLSSPNNSPVDNIVVSLLLSQQDVVRSAGVEHLRQSRGRPGVSCSYYVLQLYSLVFIKV